MRRGCLPLQRTGLLELLGLVWVQLALGSTGMSV
jgi:hypothetical protein